MTFTQEQRDLRAYLRSFLAEHNNKQDVLRRYDSDDGFDARLWARMAAELGLQGIGIAEDMGGVGGSWVELGIAFEELGRNLTSLPYLSSAASAVPALILSGDQDAASVWLPRIAAGTVAAVGVPGTTGAVGSSSMTVSSSNNGAVALSGRADGVLDGVGAELLILSARTLGDERDQLFLVTGDAPGLRRTAAEGLDRMLRLATVELLDSPAVALGRSEEARRIITEVGRRFAVAVAALAVGGARACLDMALEYSRTRSQFGRPIGAFQSLKHRFADLVVAVESASGVARCAARAIADDATEAELYSSLARSYCCDTYVRLAEENIQLHGGIGFTWEHTAHLHYRRAIALQNLLQTNDVYKDGAAEALGLTVAQHV